MDFRDLNDACSKDKFPFVVAKLMIDAASNHEAVAFIDCTIGYSQIQMALTYQVAIMFHTPKGIFYSKMMLFSLKKAMWMIWCHI